MEHVLYRFGHTVIKTYTQHILRMDLDGLGTVPEGPKIFAANHPTTTDPFYLLALSPQKMSLLITEMAFKAPLFGSYLRGAGHIEVVHSAGRRAFDAAVEALKNDGTVGIFPEGALSPRVDVPGRARTGTVRMALLAGVPIVPVGICVSEPRVKYVETTIDDMTEMARWYPFGPYAMTIGDPITLNGSINDWGYVRYQSEQLMKRIHYLVGLGARRLASGLTVTTSF